MLPQSLHIGALSNELTSSNASTRYGISAGFAKSSGLCTSEMHSSTTMMLSAVGFVATRYPSALTVRLQANRSMSTCCCVKVNSEPPSSLPNTPQPA